MEVRNQPSVRLNNPSQLIATLNIGEVEHHWNLANKKYFFREDRWCEHLFLNFISTG